MAVINDDSLPSRNAREMDMLSRLFTPCTKVLYLVGCQRNHTGLQYVQLAIYLHNKITQRMEKSMTQLEGNGFGVKAKCLTIYKETHIKAILRCNKIRSLSVCFLPFSNRQLIVSHNNVNY